jgi:hypothetical protein
MLKAGRLAEVDRGHHETPFGQRPVVQFTHGAVASRPRAAVNVDHYGAPRPGVDVDR